MIPPKGTMLRQQLELMVHIRRMGRAIAVELRKGDQVKYAAATTVVVFLILLVALLQTLVPLLTRAILQVPLP